MVIEEYFDEEFCEYCWNITTHYIKEISEKEDIKIIKECTICYTEKEDKR